MGWIDSTAQSVPSKNINEEYSNFPELQKLSLTTSTEMLKHYIDKFI